MKQKRNKRTVLTFGLAVALSAAGGAATSFYASPPQQQQAQTSQPTLSPRSRAAVAAFEQRARDYVALRERVEEKLPKLSKDSTAEQIAAHEKAFRDAVLAARTGAKPGDVFTREIAAHIRATIKREYRGSKLRELREAVMEADTKGVPVRVNFAYPESKEQVEIPPTLLLQLPQLPKQLRYRFVGRNLLLVDRENGLIIDYMLKALP
jgi:hypothetical protein